MRVRARAEHDFQEVAGIMRPEVDARILALKPARQESKVNGGPKAVHLGEERDEEHRQRAERAPISCIASLSIERGVVSRPTSAVIVMHEEVHQRAGEQKQMWQYAEKAPSVLVGDQSVPPR